jgi:hypothetical protein
MSLEENKEQVCRQFHSHPEGLLSKRRAEMLWEQHLDMLLI